MYAKADAKSLRGGCYHGIMVLMEKVVAVVEV